MGIGMTQSTDHLLVKMILTRPPRAMPI